MKDKNKFRKINYLKEKKFDNLINLAPHPLMRTSQNINWLKERSSPKILTESLNKFYEAKVDENIKSVIKPEYLFNITKFNKISDLRDLFAEFDKDRSSKIYLFIFLETLELSEIKQMFKTNKIPLEMHNIVELFFKSKETTKNYLDFCTLVDYAISTHTDEKYRTFMRKLKNSLNKDQTLIYLPMNFNRLLEHFDDKGKIRENINNVDNTINNLDKITDHVIKLKSLATLEKEELIHNKISYSNVIDNFKDIIQISSRKMERIKQEKNKIKEEKLDMENIKFKSPQKSRRSSISSSFNKFNLPEISNRSHSTNLGKNSNETTRESNCPKQMNSLYNFYNNVSQYDNFFVTTKMKHRKTSSLEMKDNYSFYSMKTSRRSLNEFKGSLK